MDIDEAMEAAAIAAFTEAFSDDTTMSWEIASEANKNKWRKIAAKSFQAGLLVLRQKIKLRMT